MNPSNYGALNNTTNDVTINIEDFNQLQTEQINKWSVAKKMPVIIIAILGVASTVALLDGIVENKLTGNPSPIFKLIEEKYKSLLTWGLSGYIVTVCADKITLPILEKGWDYIKEMWTGIRKKNTTEVVNKIHELLLTKNLEFNKKLEEFEEKITKLKEENREITSLSKEKIEKYNVVSSLLKDVIKFYKSSNFKTDRGNNINLELQFAESSSQVQQFSKAEDSWLKLLSQEEKKEFIADINNIFENLESIDHGVKKIIQFSEKFGSTLKIELANKHANRNLTLKENVQNSSESSIDNISFENM